jgi:hypothetical protein
MPLIIPANSITGGYEVDNSLRFDDGSSDNLTRTPSSNGNKQIWTWSGWVKRGAISTWQGLFQAGSNNNITDIHFYTDDKLYVRDWNGSSLAMYLVTNRLFRDVSAWYHLVVAVDTTQSTASNRVKIYINGTQETSFSTETYPSQNLDTNFNDTSHQNIIGIAYQIAGSAQYYDGYMAEVVFIDGTALDPTSFGEFDADSGIWKPKAVSGLTFGTNGFYLDFENSGSLGADVSGNGNNFTVNNLTSIDQTTDTPTNNFCTMSTPTWFDGTKANGGLTISTNQTSYRYQPSSIGVSSGKWYWEIKLTTLSDYALMGITDAASPIQVGTNWILGSGAYDYSVVYNTAGGNGHKYNNAGTSPTNTPGAFMGGFAQGNIVMFALDCDNNTLKIGVNDSWSNGSGSTNQTFSTTTAISITAPASTNTGVYFPAVGDYGGGTSVFDLNFGSPPFTISSGNSDGNSRGNFEYEVPEGYYSLCTANLAEFG